MELKEWMNKILPASVERLEKSILAASHVFKPDGLGLTGREEIYEILDYCLGIFFPSCRCTDELRMDEINIFLHEKMRHMGYKLYHHLVDVLDSRGLRSGEKVPNPAQKASEILMIFMDDLPNIREMIMLDVQAALDGDPAATSLDEIMLSYPSVEAVATHRVAHKLYELDVPLIPRIMSERAHSRTGIDIHPGAKIGKSFFIDHGTGVVIGETCSIGDNVIIYQGVTLGATSPFDKQGKPRKGQKRHPDIEDDVIIYANATILGGRTVIGKGSIIGGNTWIIESIPARTIVSGNQECHNCVRKTDQVQ